jgi:hypothetical protein
MTENISLPVRRIDVQQLLFHEKNKKSVVDQLAAMLNIEVRHFPYKKRDDKETKSEVRLYSSLSCSPPSHKQDETASTSTTRKQHNSCLNDSIDEDSLKGKMTVLSIHSSTKTTNASSSSRSTSSNIVSTTRKGVDSRFSLRQQGITHHVRNSLLCMILVFWMFFSVQVSDRPMFAPSCCCSCCFQQLLVTRVAFLTNLSFPQNTTIPFSRYKGTTTLLWRKGEGCHISLENEWVGLQNYWSLWC